MPYRNYLLIGLLLFTTALNAQTPPDCITKVNLENFADNTCLQMPTNWVENLLDVEGTQVVWVDRANNRKLWWGTWNSDGSLINTVKLSDGFPELDAQHLVHVTSIDLHNNILYITTKNTHQWSDQDFINAQKVHRYQIVEDPIAIKKLSRLPDFVWDDPNVSIKSVSVATQGSWMAWDITSGNATIYYYHVGDEVYYGYWAGTDLKSSVSNNLMFSGLKVNFFVADGDQLYFIPKNSDKLVKRLLPTETLPASNSGTIVAKMSVWNNWSTGSQRILTIDKGYAYLYNDHGTVGATQLQPSQGNWVQPAEAVRLKVGDQHEGGTIFYLEPNGTSGKVYYIDNTRRTWHQAVKYCNDLVHGGKSDWYLPSIQDILYLHELNIISWNVHDYWSATSQGHPEWHWTLKEWLSQHGIIPTVSAGTGPKVSNSVVAIRNF